MILAVIIPTHNRKELLGHLINQLNEQKEKSFELIIVVVDDGSTDGTYEMLRHKYSDVHIVKGTGNWWFTKCLNEGCKYTERFNPDYLLTLNDDTSICDDYLLKLITYTNQKPNSLIGSLNILESDKCKVTFSGVRKISRIFLKQYPYLPGYIEIDMILLTGIRATKTLIARGLLIPFLVLKKLKYFDEKFPQYGSDEDFCLRAKRKGFDAYISWDAIVFNNIKYTSKGSTVTKPGLIEFIKSFFNKYSVNSLIKTIRFYIRYGIIPFLPIYLVYYLLGEFKAYYKYKVLLK